MNCRTLSLYAALLLLVSACSNAPADIEVKTNADSDSDADVVRTIEVTDGTQCQLSIQKGRKDPEVFIAKTCSLKRSGDFVTSLSMGFDAPCKQYSFNNLIGDKFFFDAKAVTSPNAKCAIESFSASHGWALVQK
jgi:Tfp pilus assembly protein PilW